MQTSPTSLRRITICPNPANYRVARVSQRTGADYDFDIYVCRRHTNRAKDWGSTTGRDSGPITGSETPRCGTAYDYRPFERVVDSHFFLWLSYYGPPPEWPNDDDVDNADWPVRLTAYLAGHRHYRRDRPDALPGLVALEHAVRIAESAPDPLRCGPEERSAILAALAIAETMDAHLREADLVRSWG